MERADLPQWLLDRLETKPSRPLEVWRPDEPKNRIALDIDRNGVELTPLQALTVAAHLIDKALQIYEGRKP